MEIGYAPVANAQQDLIAQLDALRTLGVDEKHTYVDHGLTGSDRARSAMEKALTAVRTGDQRVVTKLDRRARSIRDAHDIADELAEKGVALSLGCSVYSPTDPMCKLLFNVLATVAEFEADLIRTRTREGMQVAKAKGRLRGKKPKLSPTREKRLVTLYRSSEHTTTELADEFGVARSTVYRAVERAGQP